MTEPLNELRSEKMKKYQTKLDAMKAENDAWHAEDGTVDRMPELFAGVTPETFSARLKDVLDKLHDEYIIALKKASDENQ